MIYRGNPPDLTDRELALRLHAAEREAGDLRARLDRALAVLAEAGCTLALAADVLSELDLVTQAGHARPDTHARLLEALRRGADRATREGR